jgi:hypothetical protein
LAIGIAAPVKRAHGNRGHGQGPGPAQDEARHAPLILSLLPDIAGYRRNFVDRSDAVEGAESAIDFDCVPELYFAGRPAYERFRALSADPAVARAIAADEENIFDRAATRLLVVEEAPEPDDLAPHSNRLPGCCQVPRETGISAPEIARAAGEAR